MAGKSFLICFGTEPVVTWFAVLVLGLSLELYLKHLEDIILNLHPYSRFL